MTKKKNTAADIKNAINNLPYAKDDWTEKDFKEGHVHFLGTGHEKAVQYFKNPGGRPSATDKKIIISMRLKTSDVEKLRASGPGWQTRASNYLSHGIANGRIFSASGK